MIFHAAAYRRLLCCRPLSPPASPAAPCTRCRRTFREPTPSTSSREFVAKCAKGSRRTLRKCAMPRTPSASSRPRPSATISRLRSLKTRASRTGSWPSSASPCKVREGLLPGFGGERGEDPREHAQFSYRREPERRVLGWAMRQSLPGKLGISDYRVDRHGGSCPDLRQARGDDRFQSQRPRPADQQAERQVGRIFRPSFPSPPR